MAEIKKTDLKKVDLSNGMKADSEYKILGLNDTLADRIGVELADNGNPVYIGGASVVGLFIRADGNTVTVPGTAAGNTAYIDLPQACYAVPGPYALSLKITSSGVTGTMRILCGEVKRTMAGEAIDPGSVIPTIEELLALLEQVRIDDTQASADHPWSGAKVQGELNSMLEHTAPFYTGSVTISSGGVADIFTSIIGRKYIVLLSAKKANGFGALVELKNGSYVGYKGFTSNRATITAQTEKVKLMCYGSNTYNGYYAVYDVTDNDALLAILNASDYTEGNIIYGGVLAEYANFANMPQRVCCIGDSLTQATNGGTPYTTPLAALLGRNHTVYNFGIGGEYTTEIMARQGARPAEVQPVTIPASGSVNVQFTGTALGRNIGVTVASSAAAINPVTIAGVQGTLNKSGNTYTFTRAAEGDAVQLTRPEIAHANPEKIAENAIQILWMGTNGGWNKSGQYDPQMLVKQYELMVRKMKNLNRPFIILGMHYFYGYIQGVTFTELETALSEAFGRKFLNYRAYITTPIYSGDSISSCYGLDDVGITPTSEDLSAIAAGNIPPSLLMDDLHFNTDGNTIIANLVYRRGIELGYWA